MTNLLKSVVFSDIHWGAKSNSDQHNQDCMNYIDWFCDNVRNDPSIDNLMFLGDWFENRSSININTLNQAYEGAKKINDLGLPVFFIIGNHDLYHRHNRDIHSLAQYAEFDNFKIFDTPTVVDEIGIGGALLSPFLFHHEYPNLLKHDHLKTWWGHFEFKDFIVTGYTVKMPTGPDAKDYANPGRIFCGHFHKRQIKDNIVYVGNTFPTNFSDAGDSDRGMAVYDHTTDDLVFHNWNNCPTYIKCKLTQLLNKKIKIIKGARVHCVVDVPITFEESVHIRKEYTDKYSLREFTLEETPDIQVALEETETIIDWEAEELTGTNDLVIRMLEEIEVDTIDNQFLITLYKEANTNND